MSHEEQMADLKGLDIDHGNRIEVANLIPFLKNLARLMEEEIVQELGQYATDVKVQAYSDGFIGSFDLI
jgi:Ca2+-binding EF-hand superfamily protein